MFTWRRASLSRNLTSSGALTRFPLTLIDRPKGELTKKGCASDLWQRTLSVGIVQFGRERQEAGGRGRSVRGRARGSYVRRLRARRGIPQVGDSACVRSSCSSRGVIMRLAKARRPYPMYPGIVSVVARLPSSNTLLAMPTPLHWDTLPPWHTAIPAASCPRCRPC